jgi:hypothetical protein
MSSTTLLNKFKETVIKIPQSGTDSGIPKTSCDSPKHGNTNREEPLREGARAFAIVDLSEDNLPVLVKTCNRCKLNAPLQELDEEHDPNSLVFVQGVLRPISRDDGSDGLELADVDGAERISTLREEYDGSRV